ncbi:hypothetical protein GOP47_0012467 [Adiantum capillus-veneris]|uniref:Uncharacterized protein n=1 Tax=Adiantum capillus-veneris TaxID=13818 RepID=A0A9D4URE3_ADICA|nr:hypothetical protein GOP47_0012467 [Adiantum capillus-veneris]
MRLCLESSGFLLSQTVVSLSGKSLAGLRQKMSTKILDSDVKKRVRCQILMVISSLSTGHIDAIVASEVKLHNLVKEIKDVLNNYGTHMINEAFNNKYFKVDIVDSHNSNTITIVIGASLINLFLNKMKVGKFVHIEGASVRQKNSKDGGSSSLSLYLDGSSVITTATSSGLKNYLGTIAFVIIKCDNIEVGTSSIRGELLVADGSDDNDRANLSFVNDRKEVCRNIVREIENGTTVMRSNRLRRELLQTYNKQTEDLGYGQEIFDVLQFTNINSVLVEPACKNFHSNKIQKTAESLYCVTCERFIEIVQIPKLQVKIRMSEKKTVHAQLTSSLVDDVLHLRKSFCSVSSKSVITAREILSLASRTKKFKVNLAGVIVAFTEQLKN